MLALVPAAPLRMADPALRSHALFEAVLQNDEIDLAATLPATIDLNYDQDAISRSFQGALAVWNDGFVRSDLSAISRQLRQDGSIGPQEQLFFKHIRARFKHLRFAFAMFGARHRYPLYLDLITSVMGNLQDAFKNEVRRLVRRDAMILQILCTPPAYGVGTWETGRFAPCTTRSFKAYIAKQAMEIRQALDLAEMTAHEFHDIRKIISRNRAAFVTLSIMEPNANNAQTARFLATINGLMGNYHDLLMARKLNGTLDYDRDREALKPEVRERLEALSTTLMAATTL